MKRPSARCGALFFLLVLAFPLLEAGTDLERLTAFLKGRKITVAVLERDYSCYPLTDLLERGLSSVKNLEKAVRDSRENTRIAGLFPKVSAWAKYRNDDRLYLYQQNNISVGKDYITVGPDDNNSTIGDIRAFEVGGRLDFDLSRLLYNTDLIKFSDQEQKLHHFRTELIQKMVYAYYYIAVVKALTLGAVEVPPEIFLTAEITARELAHWLREITGLKVEQCDAPTQ